MPTFEPGSVSRRARVAAGVIAAVAGGGLAVQTSATLALTGGVAAAAWVMIGYFTVTTNLIVAALFTAIAAGVEGAGRPRLVAGVALAMLLVGFVYALLLRGLRDLSGGDAVADVVLHQVTPVLVPLFWLIFTPKGTLTPLDPPIWAIYPFAYLAYALARGAATGRYAYPFLNIVSLGWGRVALNVALMGVGFLAAAYAAIVLDGRLARWGGRG